jgi:hypothetical protein
VTLCIYALVAASVPSAESAPVWFWLSSRSSETLAGVGSVLDDEGVAV